MDKLQREISKLQSKANGKHSLMNFLLNKKKTLESTPESKNANKGEIEDLGFEIDRLRQQHRVLLAEVNSLKNQRF